MLCAQRLHAGAMIAPDPPPAGRLPVAVGSSAAPDVSIYKSF
jgi:hypothetical protein